MSKKSFPPSDFRSEKSDMAFTAEAVRDEMQRHVSAVASLVPDACRKSALQFAASALRMPYGRVRSMFYGEARRIDAHEADKIRAYVEAAHQLIEARAEYDRQRAAFVAEAHPAVLRLAQKAGLGAEVSEAVAEPSVGGRGQ